MRRALFAILGSTLISACHSSPERFVPPAGKIQLDAATPPEADGSGVTPPPVATCFPEGTIETCGQIIVRVGNYETCSTGHHVCQNAVWSDCVGDHFVTRLIDAGPD